MRMSDKIILQEASTGEKLYLAAFEKHTLLRLMLEEKMIPKKELYTVIKQTTEIRHKEVDAQLLNYNLISNRNHSVQFTVDTSTAKWP